MPGSSIWRGGPAPTQLDQKEKQLAQNASSDVHTSERREAVASQLRQLTANLLRITRGSGRPQSLYQEMALCLEAMQNYEQSTGRPISASAIRAMLNWDQSWAVSAPQDSPIERRDLGWERLLFLRDITQASLQIAASSLLGQNTQRSQGLSEVFSAVRRFEEARKRETRANRQRSHLGLRRDDADDHRYCRFDTLCSLPSALMQLHSSQ